MLSESNQKRKPDAVLIDADFSNDPLFFDEILNSISEKSNFVVSNVICPYNGFISSNISNECDKYVPNE
ncbi:unnamed protein product [Schistosoma mattheei]|uniref:Uncharacterized protein n=1 Tax=Schistosoma mattheei TaxID=31246 RepID=A0A183P2P9_9TREM|nr:unnamed protein product [Schistosoma mattheei]